MGAAMNGMALHGGFIPYGGTFLVFSDYARGAIRLSALMGLRVIYVLTHDSIGLGEDGPTHQPVEHLAALRAMPNLLVFRPADAVETAECWQAALGADVGAFGLWPCRVRPCRPCALRRQRKSHRRAAPMCCAKPRASRDVTLLATGSEVELAVAAAEMLARKGVKAAVVSMPCWELFERQSADYRRAVLGTAPRVGVEAALRFGWDRWIGENGAFIGMTVLRRLGAGGRTVQAFRHHGGRCVVGQAARTSPCWLKEKNMARITLRQLLDCAAERSYGVPAFNINNMEQALAIMEAARACNAPVIIQASRGARAYAGDIMLAEDDGGAGTDVSGNSALHPSGPWRARRHLPLGHPERFYLGDDGRLAQGGRQDPRPITTIMSPSPPKSRASPIWSALRSRANWAASARWKPAMARPRTATASRASSTAPAC